MARTLNRMIAGLGTHEVIMDWPDPMPCGFGFGLKPCEVELTIKELTWSRWHSLAAVK